MLICLFFTVRSEEDNTGGILICGGLEEKACKDTEEKDGFNCCWYEAKAAGEETKTCITMEMKNFEDYFDETKKVIDDLSIDCSGKYLYVASLLLLFFVF